MRASWATWVCRRIPSVTVTLYPDQESFRAAVVPLIERRITQVPDPHDVDCEQGAEKGRS